MKILINPNAFISMYFQSVKTEDKPNEIRIGNKGSKAVMKDGTMFFDHEEDNHTSMFNEIMRREGYPFNYCIKFCEDMGLLLDNNFKRTVNPKKQTSLDTFEKDLTPFGFTDGHWYLKDTREIEDLAFPENTLFWNQEKRFLAHRISDIKMLTIGYQRIFINLQRQKWTSPKIFGQCKGGKTVINHNGYEEIILVEGLEDGLTLNQSYLANNICKTIWVMTGVGNFMNVILPEENRKVLIAIDNDDAGEKMFQKCLERFSNLKKAVSRLRPKPEYKDFNDELRGIKNVK